MYHAVAFNHKTIQAIYTLSNSFSAHLEVIVFAEYMARMSNQVEFNIWLRRWAKLYNHLSNVIRYTRSLKFVPGNNLDDIHTTLQILRKLANTMLNARTFAVNLRRARYQRLMSRA